MDTQDIIKTILLIYSLPIILWLIAFFVGIVIRIMLSSYFYEIACEKGFEEKRYFWVPFLFGIVGFIMVAALPDRGMEYEITPTVPNKPQNTD